MLPMFLCSDECDRSPTEWGPCDFTLFLHMCCFCGGNRDWSICRRQWVKVWANGPRNKLTVTDAQSISGYVAPAQKEKGTRRARGTGIPKPSPKRNQSRCFSPPVICYPIPHKPCAMQQFAICDARRYGTGIVAERPWDGPSRFRQVAEYSQRTNNWQRF